MKQPFSQPDPPSAADPCASSLDPLDWDAFRHLAHAALDDAIHFLQSARERPVWQPAPPTVRAALAQPLPVSPQDLSSVYREFTQLILPYSVGNTHPRFFGWVHGNGLASGILAEMLAAALNENCGGRDHAGLYVERCVIDWSKAIFNFPPAATGLLVSGTSMATLLGLAIARHASLPVNQQLIAYTSSEAHSSVSKALQTLGPDTILLRSIPVHEDFTINLTALRDAIAHDRQAGLRPFCVIGTAGTVNTGAIDDLETLAALCRSEQLWFHIDGAFGALAILAESIRPRLRGIARADSLAFDFHKWMHVQYDAGCLLVRDGNHQRNAFCSRPAYLMGATRGLAGGGDWPCDLGPELSRSFRALKIWFALKEHGVRRFGEAIERNCRQARYLAGLLSQTPNIELMNSPSLNIVCFRVCPPRYPAAALDRFQEDLAADIQESGRAVTSTTRIRGSVALRVNITNHRTCDADLDLLVDTAVKMASRRAAAELAHP